MDRTLLVFLIFISLYTHYPYENFAVTVVVSCTKIGRVQNVLTKSFAYTYKLFYLFLQSVTNINSILNQYFINVSRVKKRLKHMYMEINIIGLQLVKVKPFKLLPYFTKFLA